MSFSSGVFSINSAGQPTVTGTVISSTVFNAFTADIATGLSTCVLKDGTQTLTANIPMGNFKLTGLSAGTASGNSIRYEQVNGVVTTAGDIIYASGAGAFSRLAIGTARQQLATNSAATAPEWVASMQSLLTTIGDTIQTTAANTAARLAATSSVAAHATTSDVWTARETILTGTAVTFTDIADAPYVGAVAWVYQNAAHTWTDGAVFDVQGGANYTAAIGDWVRINAVTVSTFDVTIFKADGTAVVGTTVATQAQVDAGTASNVYIPPSLNRISLGTEIASTSGTSIDFTDIPAGTRRIKIMLTDVSTSGTSIPIVQLGDAGGIESSGYVSRAAPTNGTGAVSTAGLVFVSTLGATASFRGCVTLDLKKSSDFSWISTGSVSDSVGGLQFVSSGAKSLSAELDRVRITTSGGTDTFDGGVINISYER